jgi:C4-dicarboxylate-specific signal transduction histidine kinase
MITVITRKEEGKIIIKIRDNGLGISKKYLDKIYQPFLLQSQQAREPGLAYL